MDIVETEIRAAMFVAIKHKDEQRAVELWDRLSEYRADHK